MPPFARYARSGGNTIRSLRAIKESRDSYRIVGSSLTDKSDGAPPLEREEEQKHTLLSDWATISAEKIHLHLGTPNS